MDGMEKLREDVDILVTMADKVHDYLRTDVLFGDMPRTMPRMTLGGYLMRRHRLLALHDELSAEDQERVDTAVAQFQTVIDENVVRTESRAQEEAQARLRQWEQYIRDLRRDPKVHGNYYGTAVEPRAMLDGLIDLLAGRPFDLDEEIPKRLDLLDKGLGGVWQHTAEKFVWPDGWQAAYPPKKYWWLYGQPAGSE